jgi:hypothetical protein
VSQPPPVRLPRPPVRLPRPPVPSQPWFEDAGPAGVDDASPAGSGSLLAEPSGSEYQLTTSAGPVVPGFEFDQRIERSARFGIDPDLFGMIAPAIAPPDHRPQDHRPQDHRPRDSRAASHRGGDRRRAADAQRGAAASTEWATLVRSFLPQPANRNWSAEFRAALHFRGWLTRVGVPILAMIILGVAVVVISGANSGSTSPTPSTASLGFPPASLAGSEFTVAPGGRGISQTLDQVASDGTEIVAVGAQDGARIARAQFYVSRNGGRTWTMGAVRTPDGAEPPPGHAARFVAGGQGQWVAVGPDSIWTSTDGRTWTLSPSAGMPLRTGDRVSQVIRTASGFIAVGSNVPGGDQAKSGPVIFLSATGTSWRRADVKLPAGTGHVLDLTYAAAAGQRILIAGEVSTTEPAGKSKRPVTTQSGGAWLSSDNGLSWAAVSTPAARGAQPQIAGLAAVGDGFVLARPATVKAGPAVDVYRSASGTSWSAPATLAAPGGLVAGEVNGGPDGAVVTGRSGASLTAFVSTDGTSWQQTQDFGAAAAESVSGAAITRGGAVITGTTAADDTRQPAIAVVGAAAAVGAPTAPPDQVDVAKIPGAFDPQLAVNGVAAASGTQVVVGSADGFPAAWVSADGGSSWIRAGGATPAVLARPGTQQLTGVTHGPAGWLAVGGVVSGAAPHPVVVSSATGDSWQSADDTAAFSASGLVTAQAAAGPGGYVIVGYQQRGPGRTVAAAWWSAGLAGFQRAQNATPGALDGAGANRQMLAVIASAKGFVAVGAAGNQAAAWTSPDGRTWRQASLPVPMGAVRTTLKYVASNGRTVVAVGTAVTTTGQQVPIAASSPDGGFTWTESALPVPAGQASVTALAAAGGQFTVAGAFGTTASHQDVVVWTSADGAVWKAVTPAGEGLTGPGIQEITSLTASGNTLTGVGYTASPASEQPVFWQSPIR